MCWCLWILTSRLEAGSGLLQSASRCRLAVVSCSNLVSWLDILLEKFWTCPERLRVLVAASLTSVILVETMRVFPEIRSARLAILSVTNCCLATARVMLLVRWLRVCIRWSISSGLLKKLFARQQTWNNGYNQGLERRIIRWNSPRYIVSMPWYLTWLNFGKKKIPTPSFNYLRENMIKTLDEKDVEFDLMVQGQTDPHRMPIGQPEPGALKNVLRIV